MDKNVREPFFFSISQSLVKQCSKFKAMVKIKKKHTPRSLTNSIKYNSTNSINLSDVCTNRIDIKCVCLSSELAAQNNLIPHGPSMGPIRAPSICNNFAYLNSLKHDSSLNVQGPFHLHNSFHRTNMSLMRGIPFLRRMVHDMNYFVCRRISGSLQRIRKVNSNLIRKVTLKVYSQKYLLVK